MQSINRTDRGLIIKSPWIEKILEGEKTWEIRGAKTAVRGTIALIKSGSGTILGFCDLVDVIGPITLEEFSRNQHKHCVPFASLHKGLRYPKTYAWVLKNVKQLKKPLHYNHPRGAIIWVRL